MRYLVLLIQFSFLHLATPSGVFVQGGSYGVCRRTFSPSFLEQVPFCQRRSYLYPIPAASVADDGRWEGPANCLHGFCLYSTARRDSVLVTNGENAKAVMSMLSVDQRRAHGSSNQAQEEEMFRVAEVPGKGIGLIAKRLIREGDEVMVRRPSLVVQVAAQARINLQLRDELYGRALDAVSHDTRQKLMAMVGHDLGDKIDKNCFRLRMGADEAVDSADHYLACYPDVARLNHDCRPSLVYSIENGTHTVSAVRDISVGEELSISYIRLLSPRAQRLAELRHWGFECSCAQCTMSNMQAAQSDARLRAISGLEADLDNSRQKLVMPETGHVLVDLYEQERLHVYMGRAYTKAALNYAAFGMEEEAERYAKLAAEAAKRESGSGSADFESMKSLSENPTAHWIWGYRLEEH
ncbi:hypothetical protein QBC47DRAFT_306708 [Echria macrotheca]|uniref:SET domain-containing protein n=1 Tax=Echria macrotheca TaxID=438768 RepID=A0AAJ0F8M4_9PEZI|nr:hypothetical protein QBC47DRAFT_306708 [Echria macrotheca]